MAFDPYAFAEEHGLTEPGRANRANRANPQPPISTISTISTERGSDPKPNPRAPAPSPQPIPAPPPGRPSEVSPHGTTADGRPLTWTGKVVSLAEWRRLSEWERHGSTGKVWNGLTRQWEQAGGAE